MELVKINAVKLNPNNPRIIKDDKFKKLVQSIKDFPEMLNIRPIVVNKDMIILGGNMRYKACKEAGLKEVPIIITDLSEEKQREFLIKDNTSGGEWDWEVLANEWDVEELESWGLDVPELEVPKFLEAEEDDFDVPEGGSETDIVLGDLFEIGEHRLLCGSSTEADAVNKLFNGNNPNLMITDPPYGVNLDQSWRDKALGSKAMGKGNDNLVKNDDIADWQDAYTLFTGNIAYVWHASKFTDVIMDNLRNCDLIPCQQIIWNKSVMIMGRSDYHFKHEPCWYAVRKNKNHDWIGDRKQTTIIDAAPPNHIMAGSKEDKTNHPTQKAILCMSIPISNHSGDVYDPFTGSGTTMVASHQLNRKCYGMELDPKYCQVIVDRMKKLDSTLIIKKNGVPL
jgi:DNA modification methylase